MKGASGCCLAWYWGLGVALIILWRERGKPGTGDEVLRRGVAAA